MTWLATKTNREPLGQKFERSPVVYYEQKYREETGTVNQDSTAA
jgi:hypothetical protein